MKFLIATDGSKFSQNAIKKFCSLFEDFQNPEIKVISVAETPKYGMDPMGASAEFYVQLDADARKLASQAVRKADEEISAGFPGLKNDFLSSVISGSPKIVIVEEAEKWGADMIVLGSHGYGFWKRAFIGSVSDAVVHHAPCSVLIIRKDE